MLLPFLSSARRAILLFLLLAALVPSLALAQSPRFSTGLPSLSQNTDGTLSVALPLVNSGSGPATHVLVTQITLAGATLVSPAAFPVALSDLAAGASAAVEGDFNSSALTTGTRYLLTVRGTYVSGEFTYGFAVNRFLVMPGRPGFLTAIQRLAVVTAAATLDESLFNNAQKASLVDSQMLAYLQSRPEIEASGVSSTGNVWARFIDGRILAIGNDPLPDVASQAASGQQHTLGYTLPEPFSALPEPFSALPEPFSASVQLPSRDKPGLGAVPAPLVQVGGPKGQTIETEIPVSNHVRLLSGMGSGYPLLIDDLKQVFDQDGTYNVYASHEVGSTVEGLKAVSGDGVFYLDSHGDIDVLRDGSHSYMVWTSTRVPSPDQLAGGPEPYLEDTLPSDGSMPRLGYLIETAGFVLQKGKMKAVKDRHYAITPAFVKEYMSFGKNSFVYFDCCSSDDYAFRSACFAKGASTYAGWTGLAQVEDTDRSSLFLVPRLLGVNDPVSDPIYPKLKFTPEKPAQRPFEFQSLFQDMTAEGYGVSKVGKDLSALNFTTNENTASHFGLLAPSILNLFVTEGASLVIFPVHKANLYINGLFGTDPGSSERKVYIGNTELSVINWDTTGITCDLSDTSLAGDVVVQVHGHNSNVVQLTSYRGPLTLTVMGDGSLKETLKADVHFRADMHSWRLMPHQPLFGYIGGFGEDGLTGDSTSTYQFSGEWKQGNSTTTWSGSGSLSPIAQSLADPDLFIFDGVLTDVGIVKGTPDDFWAFSGGGLDDLRTITTVTHDGKGSTTTDVSTDHPSFHFEMTPASPYYLFDSLFNVPAGDAPPQFGDGFTTFHWGTLAATYPPDPNAAH